MDINGHRMDIGRGDGAVATPPTREGGSDTAFSVFLMVLKKCICDEFGDIWT